MKFKGHYFVIDTSALLFDPTSLFYFTDGTVVLPVSVIQELDRHKDRLDHIGSIARQINRQLYDLKKLGSLNEGIKCEKSLVTIKVVAENLEDVPSSLDKSMADDRILSVCFTLLKNNKNKKKVHLVTNDLNLSIKASAYGIDNFDFQPESKYSETSYKGYREIKYTEELDIQSLFTEGTLKLPNSYNMIENEFVSLRYREDQDTTNGVYKQGLLHIVKDGNPLRGYKIRPLNKEQSYALNLLLDPSIKIITLTGPAGTGKTLLAAAAGLYQSIEPDHKVYEKLILSRSLVVLSGKDKLGFLPGSIKEKLDPYLIPLRDAIDFIIGEKAGALDYLTATSTGHNMSTSNKPKVEIEPLQYIKGRTLRSAFFIVDEAQNLSLNEVKTIISRTDQNSKIVLLGDIDQIDNPYLNKINNGLMQVIERFKGSTLFGHIHLEDSIRSDLAALASQLL
jgi:PhoH-like ATPase